jgi:hypothetical protein
VRVGPPILPALGGMMAGPLESGEWSSSCGDGDAHFFGTAPRGGCGSCPCAGKRGKREWFSRGSGRCVGRDPEGWAAKSRRGRASQRDGKMATLVSDPNLPPRPSQPLCMPHSLIRRMPYAAYGIGSHHSAQISSAPRQHSRHKAPARNLLLQTTAAVAHGFRLGRGPTVGRCQPLRIDQPDGLTGPRGVWRRR